LSMLHPNDYNPNRMPKEMMRLLKWSILKFGFLFPIVTSWDEKLQKYRIIDGYHRYEALRQLNAKEVSIFDLKLPYHDAMVLTVNMNRIKGYHQVEKMGELFVKLEDLGVEDKEICNAMGVEPEELIRLKNQLGISVSFKNVEYANSWEIDEGR
jgi:ParB-like chromosome segregation protein Spo0J